MKKIAPIILLVVIGFLVYANSLFNGFVWDDEEQIINNNLVHSVKNIPAFFKSSTFNPAGAPILPGLYYKPLMTTFFSLIYTLFGSKPFFFHLFQLVVHLANAVLVFLILRHWLKNEKLAFFLALLFLVHPINSEAVLYISALQDVLFFFFGALALLFLIKKINFFFLLIASILLLLCLFAKETGAVFIIMILLYFLLFKKKEIYKFLLFLLPTLITYGVLRFGVAKIFFRAHQLRPLSEMALPGRLMSAPKIIFFYLKTFFWPQNLAIAQQWAVKQINFSDFFLPVIVDLAFFSLAIYFGLRVFRQKKSNIRLFLFFFLWFILGLGLHLQIVRLDMTVSDRWFYFPMVGILGMMGVITEKLKIKNEKLKIGFLIFLILFLSIRTILRTFEWRDGYTLYSHDIIISQDSPDLEENLGVELGRRGELEKAKIHFETAIELSPNSWTPYNNLGVYYARNNNFAKAEELYRTSIAKGNYYLAYENLAFLLLREKKYKEAASFSEDSLKFFPLNTKLILASVLANYQMGDLEKSLIWVRRLYELSPTAENKKLIDLIINKTKTK